MGFFSGRQENGPDGTRRPGLGGHTMAVKWVRINEIWYQILCEP